MLRRMLDARPLVAMIVAAGVGTWGLSAYPLPMDNVFLEIKPSPRSNDAARVPVVTSDLVKSQFSEFYKRCEVELAAKLVLPL